MPEKKRLEKIRDELYGAMKKCGDASYKDKVMKECMEQFYVEDFEKNLDNNRYLFTFKNGVYDLKNNIFRDGMPEDYLSRVSGVEYKEYGDNSDEMKNIERLLVQWFPDNSIRKFFLDITSDVYVGGNFEKIVAIWSGDGDNGKSVLQNVLEQMLGEYAKTLPTSLITSKRGGADNASPCLHRVGNGVRWTVIDEPESKDVINTGLLKQLTGNDKYYARPLYKEGREIKPMFKICILCNRLPNLSSNEQAVWNRTRVLPFQSTFKKNAPNTFEEQLKEKVFPIDTHFEDKIPEIITVLNYYLLRHRKHNPRHKRETPRAVLEATDRYRSRCDILKQFIDDRIIKCNNDKFVTLHNLYNNKECGFRVWHRDSGQDASLYTKNEVQEQLEKLWGPYEKGKKWKGYRLISLQEMFNEGKFETINDDDESMVLPSM